MNWLTDNPISQGIWSVVSFPFKVAAVPFNLAVNTGKTVLNSASEALNFAPWAAKIGAVGGALFRGYQAATDDNPETNVFSSALGGALEGGLTVGAAGLVVGAGKGAIESGIQTVATAASDTGNVINELIPNSTPSVQQPTSTPIRLG